MQSLRTLPIVALLTAAVGAQVPLSGAVFDGQGGPLLSGTVYHTTTSITVPAGQTLTVQPGAIVKLSVQQFVVDGTLRVQGTSGNRCVFTSIHDDTAGGDTNGNGNATALGPTQWWGVRFGAGSGSSVVTFADFRGMGWGNWNVIASGSTPSLSDCRFSDSGMGGMSLDATARPTLTRCDFQRINGLPAITGATIEALAGMLDNTASNCTQGNYVRVDTGTMVSSTSFGPRNGIDGVVVYQASILVPAGITLTLGAGVGLKALSAMQFTVDGNLFANGTAVAPVTLTSFHDDSVGGDTNLNGNATAAAPVQWWGLYFRNGTGNLNHTDIRCTGWGNWANVSVDATAPVLADCRLTDGGYGGVATTNASRPTLTRCDFQRINGRPAISGVSLDALPGFLDNTESNNPGGGFVRVDVASIAADTAIQRRNGFHDTIAFSSSINIPSGRTLTVGPGMVVKSFTALQFTVDGTLLVNGLAAQPVVFTSIHDDSVGGDTNGNGNATGLGPTQWWGIHLRSGSDASLIRHCQVRGTGWGNWANLSVTASSPTLEDCAFTDGSYGGLAVDSSARPSVARCDFQRINGRPAVSGLDLVQCAGFEHNTASNCPGGNYMSVDRGSVPENVALDRFNQINGALVYTATITVPVGKSLALSPGMVLKAAAAYQFNVSGTLLVDGPVVFTSIHDDLHGGDTNGNGSATQAGAVQWWGLRASAGAVMAADLLLVRCAGWGNWASVTSLSTAVTLRRSRSELAGLYGFDLSACAVAEDLVALGGSGDGFILPAGNFALVRATSAYNSGAGVRAQPGFSGSVRSTLAWGNSAGGFVGLAANSVNYSDGPGIAGGVGNINLDPQFVNAGIGDLRLLPTSPCVDAGDPLDSSTRLDPIGFPRFLDGNLDGTPRIDIGAYEFDHLILLVTGSPTPGGTLNLLSIATPQIPIVALALGLPSINGLPLLNFGALFVDPNGPFDVLVWPVNGSAPITIPGDLVGPVPFAFQLIGLGNPFPRGNTSNPYFFSIQ